MNKDIITYNNTQTPHEKMICDLLAKEISAGIPEAENKIWHRHPVWFLEGNPIVGYSKLKAGIRLMFWSGVSFDEKDLQPGTGKFKDASITYADVSEVDMETLQKWLGKARVFSGTIKIS